jgi:hypothetical protein
MLGGDHLLGRDAPLAAAEAFDLGDAAGVMTTPRRPRLVSSSTAQIRLRALVSPGKRPITLVRRRTSTKVRSSRFVLRIRLHTFALNSAEGIYTPGAAGDHRYRVSTLPEDFTGREPGVAG